MAGNTQYCPYSFDVEAGETVHFSANMSFLSTFYSSQDVILRVQQDGQTVAEGGKNDETASHMHVSVMLNTRVAQSAHFELGYWSMKYTTIPAKWLQYSYFIFGQ